MEGFILLLIVTIVVSILKKPNKEEYKKKPAILDEFMKEKNTIKSPEYISVTDVAKHFNISARELNKIFEKMNLIEKRDRWIIATELGKKHGAKEHYNTKKSIKYVVWKAKILNNIEIESAIKKYKNINTEKEENLYNAIKKETPKKQNMTKQEKKAKGDMYETYVANFFKKQGYYVWEHGKEKGVHDSSIDLLVKKENYIYFVQCKNWEKWKITHKEVKATRTDVREYLKKEKMLWELIKGYDSKILYVTPTACLARSAYTYIQENSNIVEYQVIPIIE